MEAHWRVDLSSISRRGILLESIRRHRAPLDPHTLGKADSAAKTAELLQRNHVRLSG